MADDDELVRRIVFRAGVHFGWEVGVAENGLEAARMLKDTHWDVLLTDIFMPAMDGVELIRLAGRAAKRTAIVAMTGGGTFEVDYLRMAQLMGARLVLQKPFSLEELVNVVREAAVPLVPPP
ncbi:MAG TPA: response regulator [Candidatus Didemnitutus sp.]